MYLDINMIGKDNWHLFCFLLINSKQFNFEKSSVYNTGEAYESCTPRSFRNSGPYPFNRSNCRRFFSRDFTGHRSSWLTRGITF